MARGKKSLRYKLVVFDLDETLWSVSDGLCNLIQPPFRLESPDRLVGQRGLWVELFPGVRGLLDTLRSRGVHISLASRNDAEPTKRLLEFLGILDYFSYPQLNWRPKEDSIQKIIKELQRKDRITVKPEEVLFVDDWPENVNAVRRWGATALLFGQDILSFDELAKALD